MTVEEKRKKILTEAESIVNGDRDTAYGDAEDNFQNIADLWSCYISSRKKRITLYAEDVAAMMILMKTARIKTGLYKKDNWIDIAGYAACGGAIQQGDEETERRTQD